MTSLEEWTRDVQPYLEDASYHARTVLRSVRALRIRPHFLTTAEIDMNEAIRTLENALTNLRIAKLEYDEKPLETA